MTGPNAAEIYHATIMERARRPRHQGRLSDFDAEAQETNPLCGDRVTITLRRGADGRIAAIGYQVRACAICIAATDLIAEIVPGMEAAEVRQTASAFEGALRHATPIDEDGPLAPLRAFQPLSSIPSRIGCATLGWRALVKALTP